MHLSFRLSRTQRGDVLLESLIGLLLITIVGLGLVYTTSKVELSHSHAMAENLAISQMRDLLQRYGTSLCTDTSQAVIKLPPNNQSYALSVDCVTPTVTVKGAAIAHVLKSVTLTTPTSANDYFGGPLKVGD